MGEQVAARINGDVAQLGEHLPCKQGVKGSNPSISRSIKSQRSRGLGQTTGCIELARKQTDGWHKHRICGAYP